MPVIGEAVLQVVADTTSAEQSFRNLQQQSSGLRNLGQGLATAGRTLTLGLTLPIVGLGAAALKTSIDFESAFAGVRKTVEATEPQFKVLETGFRNMAKEIPATAVELANIGEVAGQLGVKREGILEFTRVIADLGETTNLVGEEAASALARISNIMGTSQGDFDRLGSTIVALGNAGASTEAEITTMALRIAGAGSIVGLTEAQVLGFANALSSVGVEAEAGGSAISRTFITIANAVASGGQDLAGFAKVAGTSAASFKQAFEKDAAGATVQFIEGLKRIQNEGVNVFGILDDLGLGEIRVRDALLRASEAGDLFSESLRLGSQAWRENSALTEEAGKRYATTAAQLEIARNKAVDLLISLGDALKPVLVNLLQAAAPILSFAETMVNAFARLPGPVQTGLVAFAGLLAALGPVLFIAGQMVIAFTALAPVFAVLGAGLAAIAAPAAIVIAIIAGVAAAAFLLITHWDTIKAALITTWEAIKTAAVAVFDFLKFVFLNFTPLGLIIQHWETVKAVLAAIWNVIATVAKAVASLIVIPWVLGALAIKKIWTEVWQFLAPFLRAIWNGILAAARAVFNAIRTAIVAAVNAVRGPVIAVWNAISAALRAVWNALSAAARAAWNAIVAAARAASGPVRAVVNAISGALRSLAGPFNAIGGFARAAWNAVVNAFQSAYNRIAGIVSSIKNTFCNLPFVPCSPIPLVEDAKAAVKGVTRAFEALRIPEVHSAIGFDSPAVRASANRLSATTPASARGAGVVFMEGAVQVNEVTADPRTTAEATSQRIAERIVT